MSTPTTLTEAKLAANRANAQRSTGPSTPEGKSRGSRNSLKHGCYAEASRETMLALGEDPEEFAQLHEELMEAYPPPDAIARGLIEDLAKLYWRQRRWQRASDGLLRAERKHWELEQEARAEDKAQDASTIPHEDFKLYGLRYRPHSAAKYAKLISLLEMLCEHAERRDFAEDLSTLFELIYGERPLWRAEMIWFLWRVLYNAQYTGKQLPGTVCELLKKELEEEIASLRGWAERCEPAQDELARAERDARLMPYSERWVWMTQQGNALDRAIDRKIRLLLAYEKRKAGVRSQKSEGGTGKKSEVRSQKTVGRTADMEQGTGSFEQATAGAEGRDNNGEETNPRSPLPSTIPAPRRSGLIQRSAGRKPGGANADIT
jgi:hypothetical protein